MIFSKERSLQPGRALLFTANLIPLAGIFIWDWHAVTILSCYFLETIIIGFYTVFKLAIVANITSAELDISTGKSKRTFSVVPFFIMHYGFFLFVQSFILTSILGKGTEVIETGSFFSGIITFLMFSFNDNGYIFLLSLLLSHGIAFIHDFIMNGKYKETDIISETFRPYSRIFLQQFLVIFGGFLMMIFNDLSVLMVFFVLLKLLIDEFFQPMIEGRLAGAKNRIKAQ